MQPTIQNVLTGAFVRIDDPAVPAGWYLVKSLDLRLSANLLTGSVEIIAKDVGYVWVDVHYVIDVIDQARADPAQALDDVAWERMRQQEQERFDRAHDDAHSTGGLARAAACYLAPPVRSLVLEDGEAPTPPPGWPWEDRWWKPGGVDEASYRRRLVKSAALTIAEIERVDRKARG